jgi:hypothetical protein
MSLDRLRIEDFSDREFLLIVADVAAEEDGWADSEQVAQRMDLSTRRLASSRLSWLRRYGAVEREHVRDEAGNIRYHRNGKPMHTQRWRLTTAGQAVAFGKLRKADETALGAAQGRADAAGHALADRAHGRGRYGRQAGFARVALRAGAGPRC